MTATQEAEDIMTKQLITQNELKDRVNLIDGCFSWKPKPVNTKYHKTWNSRYAEKRAGCLRADGYRVISLTNNGEKRLYLEHRLVFLWYNGHWPKGEIDHEKGVRNQNGIEDLRDVSSAENSKNAKIRTDNTSGITGVYWHKKNENWYVQIKIDYKTINLGSYDDKFEAVCVRKSAESQYGFHPNHGRAA